MPRSILSQNSSIYGREGWIDISRSGLGATEILGVDRYGREDVGQIILEKAGFSSREVFLGTRCAGGIFSERTKLLEANGSASLANGLVEVSRISEVRFETLVNFGGWKAVQEGILNVICLGSLTAGRRFYTFPCRNTEVSIPKGCERVKYGNRLYNQVSISEFRRNFQRNWPKAVRDILSFCYRERDGKIRFERHEYLKCLWYLAASEAEAKPVVVSFDSLLYTSSICVEETVRKIIPPSSGSCATYLTGAAENYLLSWKEREWNPISSGFILQGSY